MDLIDIILGADTAKAELTESGQVGYGGKTEKTYTFDGDISGKTLIEGMFVHISSDLPDINTIKSVTAILNGERITISKDELTIIDNSNIADEEFASAGYGEYPVVFINYMAGSADPVGLHFLYGGDMGYVSSVTFETETIHPADPKYLGIFDTQSVSKITWNGDIAGHKMSWAYGTSNSWGLCHVSDLLPKRANFVGGSITATLADGSSKIIQFDENESHVSESEQALLLPGAVAVAYKENAVVDGWDSVFPVPGVYFMYNFIGEGTSVTSVEFGTPMTTKTIKTDLIRHTVIDLDEHGIDVASLAIAGGGTAEVDASAIFDSIVRGGNYLFRGSFGTSTIDLPAKFYEYDADGNLESIGLSMFASFEGFAQIDALLQRDGIQVVVTPLGV